MTDALARAAMALVERYDRMQSTDQAIEIVDVVDDIRNALRERVSAPAEEPWGWLIEEEGREWDVTRIMTDAVRKEIERCGAKVTPLYARARQPEDGRDVERSIADDAASFMYRVGFVAGTPDEELHRALVAMAGKHIMDWKPNEYGDHDARGIARQPEVTHVCSDGKEKPWAKIAWCPQCAKPPQTDEDRLKVWLVGYAWWKQHDDGMRELIVTTVDEEGPERALERARWAAGKNDGPPEVFAIHRALLPTGARQPEAKGVLSGDHLSEEDIEIMEREAAFECGECEDGAHVKMLVAELRLLRRERDELQATLDLVWDANQRGIKAWQEATGRDMVWPDQAEMVTWLLAQLSARRDAEGEVKP